MTEETETPKIKMADDVRGQTVGPPAYSYAAPQFDGKSSCLEFEELL